MKDILEQLEDRRASARLGGGERRIEAQHAKRQADRARAHRAPARSRLLRGVRHVRRAPLHRFRHGEGRKIPGDGVVTGWGTVNGRTVFVFAKDFTVFGGSLSETHAQKIIKIQDMALKMRAPIVGLFDAGGARIQEGVAALGGYGEVFQRNVWPPASSRRSR
jgi:propionyl-CoA carboxylase beta chain